MSDAHSCELRRYSVRDKAAWDALVAGAKNPNFLFFRDYMEYHRDRFEDHSLLFFIDGRLLACLPACRVGEVLHSHLGLTYGGLVMHPDIRRAQVGAMMVTLKSYLRPNGFSALAYRPMPHIYHLLPAEEDIEALTELGGTVVRTLPTNALRLTGKIAFSPTRRRQVNRCARLGLRIERSFEFAKFMALCAEHLHRRFNIKPVHTAEEITALAAHFPDHIRLFLARDADEMTAGLIIYCNEGCARLQYIGHTPSGERTGVVAAIYAHLFTAELAPGSWFEFGHSTAHGIVNEGLYQYKESLGGRGVQIRDYRLQSE